MDLYTQRVDSVTATMATDMAECGEPDGLIAGIAICVALSVLGGIGMFIFFCRMKRRSGAPHKKQPDDMRPNGNLLHQPIVAQQSPKPKQKPSRPSAPLKPTAPRPVVPITNEYMQEEEDEEENGPTIKPRPEAPKRTPKPAAVKNDAPPATKPEEYYNIGPFNKMSTKIKHGKLPAIVKERMKEEKPFFNEFDQLIKDKDPSIDWSYCERPELKPLNRFKNIIPYDFNRVTLTSIEGDPLSDYFNASFIDGYGKKREFIASHGPVERTMKGFWRTIWEHKVPTIVMVTNFTEMATMKVNCDKYWNEKEPATYGPITVTIHSTDTFADFTVRKFFLKHSEGTKTHIVKHLQYTSWPDHGVPENINSLLSMRRLAKQPENAKEPVLVHCRAGIGRTGTFIALDYLLDEIKAKAEVDIFNCVVNLRRQRINMVQTPVQYAFLYQVLREVTLIGETTISCQAYQAYYATLAQGNPNPLQKQFQALEEMKPEYPDDELAEARQCMHLNRDPAVLPPASRRFFFVNLPNGANPYINAVFVKGYKEEAGYIASQVPVPDSLGLFWQMVYEKSVRSIVCVQNKPSNIQWFPTEGKHCVFGSLVVKCEGKSQSGAVLMKNISIDSAEVNAEYANMGRKGDQAIGGQALKMFVLRDWTEKPVNNREIRPLMDLITEVQNWQQGTNNPILTVCMNGATESGLFIASHYAINMTQSEQEVDVAQATKQIRISRPQFLPTQDHYKLIHTVLLEYVETTHTYSNLKV